MDMVRDFVTQKRRVKAIQYSTQKPKITINWLHEYGAKYDYNSMNYEVRLQTDEGVRMINAGDWVIRDYDTGMFSVMNPAKFRHFYEPY